jgi:internalin A
MDSVSDSVRASVSDSVWASVRDSVSVKNLRDILREYSFYGDVSDFGWVSFYDFFTKIGILNNEIFNEYAKFIKANCFTSYMYDNYVFAIQPPVYIERNAQGRLHSTTTAAVEFRDGSQYYFINGRSVPSWIITDRDKISRERFLQEENAEIKAAMYEVLGQKGIMSLLGAETVDVQQITHANGDVETVELLKTKETFPEIDNKPFCWVKVCCPSSGTNYLLGVNPEYTDAKEAVASLSPFKKEEYSYDHRS